MKIPSSLFFRPSSMAMCGALGSALVWLLPLSPGEFITGYSIPTRPTVLAVTLIVEWYVVIFLSMRMGELTAERSPLFDVPRVFKVSIDSVWLLRCLTALTALGLGATYIKIIGALSPVEIWLYLLSGNANEIKENLYDEYSVGLVSLRYLAMFSLTLSIYRWTKLRKFDWLLLVNVLLLTLSAILSQRLIFVASLVATFFLLLHTRRYLRLRMLRIVLIALAIFSVLALLNYSRNSNYYATDDVDFWQAGIASIVTYVGSPFQVMLSVAANPDGVVGEAGESYRRFTDISETLNSNSAFVALHELMGYWAWPYIAAVGFAAGFIFSKCRKAGETALLLPCGAILYASAELWRLDLFSKGIFIVWLTIGLALPLAIGTIDSWSARRRGLGRRSRAQQVRRRLATRPEPPSS